MSTDLKKASIGTAFLVGIGTLLLFALLVKTVFHFSAPEESYDAKRSAARTVKRQILDRENRRRLTTVAWVSKEKGIVQIPIDDAMKLVVNELKAKPVQPSSVKVENPYPAGLQQAVPAPAAAAPAPMK